MGGRGSSGTLRANGATGSTHKETSESYAEAMHNDLHAKLTSAQQHALSLYGGNQFVSINRHLRYGTKNRTYKKYLKEEIAKMDVAFKKTGRLTHDTTLYRRFSSEELTNLVKSGKAKGAIFQDKAFVSTSRRPLPGNSQHSRPGDIELRIRAKAGTKGVAMQHYGVWAEREILLNRGSRFKIMKTSTENGRTVIDVKYLPPPRTKKRK